MLQSLDYARRPRISHGALVCGDCDLAQGSDIDLAFDCRFHAAASREGAREIAGKRVTGRALVGWPAYPC